MGFIQRLLAFLMILSAALSPGLVSIAATAQQSGGDDRDVIVVHLVSGRAMTANIDARTDAKQLWLRWESPGAEVLRPIDWDCVAVAEINDDKISGNEFLDLVKQIRRDVPAQPVSIPRAKTIVMLGSPSTEASKPLTTSNNIQAQASRPSQVRWLEVDAKPARWNNYVETDGMMICITPRDAQGEVVPVRGALNVELIAEHADVVKSPYPFRRIGNWSQVVRPEDFGPLGAVYRLPFQDVNPEFSRNLGPHGAIRAILSVPGQGTFEATDDARIRPYSFIRDRLQQTTGQRFFPEETVGRPWER